MRATTSVSRLIVICTFYCCFTQIQNNKPQVNALLYHQFQPAPLLSRVNRQPQQAQTYNNIFNSSNFMTNLDQNYYKNNPSHYLTNNRQQQQPNQRIINQYQTSATARDTGEQPILEQQQRPHQYYRGQIQLNDPVPTIVTDTPISQLDSYGCPNECQCNNITKSADCSNRDLTRIPSSFPKDVKRIKLERNNITEIGPYAFRGLKRLQRVDLSNNNLQQIDPLAFSGGLDSLISLILYSNKLEYLPSNLFNDLSQLTLLLLNANSLRSIHRDLFKDLKNLTLLSLYDNNLETLPSGAFDGLDSIKTIHLGKNPLNCDCNLRWLAEFLEANFVNETTGAHCETPRNVRVQGKKLSQLSKTEFRCSDVPQAAGKFQQQQAQIDPNSCPFGCVCSGATIDCSRASSSASQEQKANGGSDSSTTATTGANGGGLYELPDVPDDVPVYVARVHINDQRIKRIRQTGLFRRLANSQKLDIGDNKIVDIEDNAINGQLANGQKPERVVFVLLENQHCGSGTPPGSSVEGPPIPVDACSSAPKVNEPHFDSPCYNGGSCRTVQSVNASSTALNYTCVCPGGFAGPLCEINIDDCGDHQCQNGGMCVDGVNSYRCVCRDPTTSGEFCEQLAASSGSAQHSASNFANSAALSTLALVAPPLALPIISNGVNSMAQQNELLTSNVGGNGHSSGQQILARSADFARIPNSAADRQKATQTKSAVEVTLPPPSESVPERPGGGGSGGGGGGGGGGVGCQRLTQRKYFDDGNGCQSVRLLKLSSCSGACALGNCCQPARVKRRRVRMQCSDGASYVKMVDLVKKCSCASGSDTCQVGNRADGNEPNEKIKSSQYFKYLTSSAAIAAAAAKQNQHYPTTGDLAMTSGFNSGNQDEQTMQITRLDAFD